MSRVQAIVVELSGIPGLFFYAPLIHGMLQQLGEADHLTKKEEGSCQTQDCGASAISPEIHIFV